MSGKSNGIAGTPEFLIDVPNDPQNEQVVLAAMMADANVRADLVASLSAEHFYAEEHKEIFKGLAALTKKGLTFDPATLARIAPDVDIRILEQLPNARPDVPPNLDHHVKMLRWDAERARFTRGSLATLLDAIQDPNESPERLRALCRRVGESFDASIASDDPFGFRSAKDIATPRDPIPLIVPEYGIGPGRPTLIAAYAGTGKTMLILDLLLSVAAGRKTALGGAISVAAHGPARLLDYELGADDTDDRSQRLAHGLEIDLEHLARLDFGIANLPRLYLSADPAEVEEALVRTMKGVVLCAIDNFTSATTNAKQGMNETSVRAYLDVLTRASLRTGCSFVVVAHDGKSGKDPLRRMRNSSAIADAANSVLSLTANKVGEITITHAKHGNTKQGKPVVVKISDVGKLTLNTAKKKYEKAGLAITHVTGASPSDGDDDEPTDRAIEAAKKAIVDTLKKTKPAPGVRELLRLVRGHATTAKKQALAELREKKLVIEGTGPRNAKPLTLAQDCSPDDDDEEGDQGADQAF